MAEVIANLSSPQISADVTEAQINVTIGNGINAVEVVDSVSSTSTEAAGSANAVRLAYEHASDVSDELTPQIEQLTTSLASVSSNLTSADTRLTKAVSAEITRASEAEASIRSYVDSEIGERDAFIEEEKERAEAAERTLKTAISDETEAREDAIEEETNRAQAAETSVKGLVTSEETRAKRIEASLSNTIEEQALTTAQLSDDINSINAVLPTKVDFAYTENGYLYLTSDGEIVCGPLGPFSGGGGGGGGGNDAVLAVQNQTGWLTKTIPSGEDCIIFIGWSSTLDDIPTGDGTATVVVNNVTKLSKNISQGIININLTNYLSNGTNKVRVAISDVYGNTRSLNFTVEVVSISISSGFSQVINTGDINYFYTPVGNVAKTVYFYLDGELYGTQTTSYSAIEMTYQIDAQKHGSHTLEVYFKCTINDTEVESNHLKYALICVQEGETTPIIASAYSATTVEQYSTISIPYYVYDPTNPQATVKLYEKVGSGEYEQLNELTVGREEQSWSYRPDDYGDLKLAISCRGVMYELSLTVTESSIDAHAETQNLALYLTSYGRSNSEAHPEIWKDSDNNISATLTGFNFSTNGWIQDEDGITALRVNNGARVTIPYKIFEQNCTSGGKTVEIEYATSDVMNYDATVFDCMSGSSGDERGVLITARAAYLASEQLKVDGDAYSSSCLQMQYKEDEHLRLGFVIGKSGSGRLCYAYINGIISGLTQYPAGDTFGQLSPVGITIGSDDCCVDIYNIRVYDSDLNRKQMINNWIADTQVGTTKKDRYDENNILDETGAIVATKLPADLPYMILEGTELPTVKGQKKTIDGTYVDPTNPSYSFTFQNASADVQGTSSAGYPRKNYKIKFSNGFVMTSTDTPVSKYAMSANAVPVNTFTFKADYASCEGANNVELVDLYNEAGRGYTMPSDRDENTRVGIEGHPIAMFWYNGTKTTFIGKYNFNNDKGTGDVYAFDSGDESWETLLNNTAPVLWKEAVTDDNNWTIDEETGDKTAISYEGRFPDGNEDLTNLTEVTAWVASTDTTVDGLTDAQKAARLAKFKDEFENYFDLNSATFYYIFTELFLMVDSRAKNSFPTRYTGKKWVWLPYDMDTALGINNEGLLRFDYNLEDTDYTDTAKTKPVYNGQASVLWNNFRQCFASKIKSMYSTLRAGKYFTYDYIESKFETHQHKWPEALFNEDAYYKYIEPMQNFSMCQGSKESQRKWWLYNRLRYIDSKYDTGYASGSLIIIRAYTRPESGVLAVTPYADIYARLTVDNLDSHSRAPRNEVTNLAVPSGWDPQGTDAYVYIHSADQLLDLGDLYGWSIGYNDFSAATRMQKLKLGDSTKTNTTTDSLVVTKTDAYGSVTGGMTMLRELDCRNCTALKTSVDLRACNSLQTALFEGSGITGVQLQDGSAIVKLHLPATLANLTLRNTAKLTDLSVAGYTNIRTLWLDNPGPAVDLKTMFETVDAAIGTDNRMRLRMIGLSWEADTADDIRTLYNAMARHKGLGADGETEYDTPANSVSGTIHVPEMTGAEAAELRAMFPLITINADVMTVTVKFYNGSTLLDTESGAGGSTIVYGGTTPTKASTAYYTYTFAGWSSVDGGTADPTILINVTEDKTVYAAFTATTRTYSVKFVNNSSGTAKTLQTVTVNAGGTATYTGDTPTYEGSKQYGDFTGWSPEPTNILADTTCIAQFEQIWYVTFVNDSSGTAETLQVVTVANGSTATYTGDTPTYEGTEEYGDFEGWSPEPKKVTANMTCTAQFADLRDPVKLLVERTVTKYESDELDKVGDSAFRYCSVLTSVSLPVATSIGNGAFGSCEALTSISIPMATSISDSAFISCSVLTSVSLPVATSIGKNAFGNCSKLTELIVGTDTDEVCTYSTTNSLYDPTNANIYVPDDLVDDYKAATNWSRLASNIHGISERR